MAWDLKNDRPIYLQLIEQLKQMIVVGTYPPGSRLLSVRELASVAAVNPNTMQKALSELEREGLVYTNRTSGRFITEDITMIQNLKLELAKEQITAFFTEMKKLGFTEEEVKELLFKNLEGETV